MIVSKRKPHKFQEPALYVDSWKTEHMENGDIEETFNGKLKMTEEKSLLYLGHVLSKQGGIMENINHKKNKAIGTEKNILRLI